MVSLNTQSNINYTNYTNKNVKTLNPKNNETQIQTQTASNSSKITISDVLEGRASLFDYMIQGGDPMGYLGSPDVKEVEGSISQRMTEGTLTADEEEMLNEGAKEPDYLPTGVEVQDVIREQADLQKTITSVSEFVKIWSAKKAERKKQFFDELGPKSITQEEKAQTTNQTQQTTQIQDNNQRSSVNSTSAQDNQTKENQETNKPFKPIQVESKSKTYKDTDRLNALELAKDRQLANMLEILFGFKSNSTLNNTDKNNLLSLFSKMNLNPTSFKGLDIKV